MVVPGRDGDPRHECVGLDGSQGPRQSSLQSCFLAPILDVGQEGRPGAGELEERLDPEPEDKGTREGTPVALTWWCPHGWLVAAEPRCPVWLGGSRQDLAFPSGKVQSGNSCL